MRKPHRAPKTLRDVYRDCEESFERLLPEIILLEHFR